MNIRKELENFTNVLEVRANGYGFKLELIGGSNEYYKVLSGAIQSLTAVSSSSKYRYMQAILEDMIELEEGIESVKSFQILLEEDLDAAVEGRIDIYTSDLTEWLNESNGHVHYLTEALEDLQFKDGHHVLANAQRKCIRDVFEIVSLSVIDYMKMKAG